MPGFTQVFGGGNIYPVQPTYSQLNYSANQTLQWPIEQAIAGVPVATDIVDLNPSAGGLIVTLPDARQVSTGYTALFNNISANATQVNGSTGATLVSLTSGTVWQLYLADNSTQAGTWRVFQFGAGVSNANAAALAGFGLQAIATTLNEHIVVNSQVANYTIQSSDRASCIEWSGGSGGVFTSPSPTGLASWFCYIKNGGTGTLTFTPASGLIDGSATKSFNPNDSCIIICDGTNFVSLGFGQSVASSFNFVQIGVTGGNLVLSGAQLNRVSYRFTGVLTSNQTITVPASIQQYWVDNETTGAFTLTVTAGAGSVTVSQGQRTILYCDGTNIINAVSGSAAPTFPDGTAAAPSITFTSDLTLGFYKAGVDILGIATAGVARGSINATGNWTINAPASGTALVLNAVSAGISLIINTGGVAPDIRARGTSPMMRFEDTGAAGSILELQAINSVAIINSNWSVTATPISIRINSSEAIGISVNRNVTVQAPSSGIAFTVIGADRIAVLNTTGGSTNALLRYQENSVNKFSVGWNTGIGYIIFDDVNSAYRLTVTPSGNFQIAAPSSTGISLQITQFSASSSVGLVVGDNTNNRTAAQIGLLNFATGQAFAGNTGEIYTTSTSPLNIGTAGAAAFNLWTNSLSRVQIGSGGNVTIAAPSSGVALTVNGLNNQNSVVINGGATSGQSYGLQIVAGTTSADWPLNITNASASHTLGLLRGDGSGVLGFNGSASTITFAAAGNVTIAAPSSGVALTINGSGGAVPLVSNDNGYSVTAFFNSTHANGGRFELQTSSSSYGQVGTSLALFGGNVLDFAIAVVGNHNLSLGANGSALLQLWGVGEETVVQHAVATNQGSGTWDIGYVDEPQNLQNVNYGLVFTDRGKQIYHTSGTAHTYTIPANASIAFPVGTIIRIINEAAAGALTIAITTDVLEWAPSGTTGSRTLTGLGAATIEKVTTTKWVISGVNLT